MKNYLPYLMCFVLTFIIKFLKHIYNKNSLMLGLGFNVTFNNISVTSWWSESCIKYALSCVGT